MLETKSRFRDDALIKAGSRVNGLRQTRHVFNDLVVVFVNYEHQDLANVIITVQADHDRGHRQSLGRRLPVCLRSRRAEPALTFY